MTTLPISGYAQNASRTKGEMKTVLENTISKIKELAGGADETPLTIASDSVTPPNDKAIIVLTPETGASDTLSRLNSLNREAGAIVYLVVDSNSNTINITPNVGGAGQIKTFNNSVVSLTNTAQVAGFRLKADGYWYQFHESVNIKLNPAGGTSGNKGWFSPADGSSGEMLLRSLVRKDIAANNLLNYVVGFGDTAGNGSTTKGILSDSIVPAATDCSTIYLTSETGTTDDLKFIDSTNIPDGSEVLLRASSAGGGHTITIRNNTATSPSGNQRKIITQSGSDVSVSGNGVFRAQRLGTLFVEVNPAASVPSYVLRFGGQVSGTSLRPLLSVPTAPTVTPQGVTGATSYGYKIVIKDKGGSITAASTAGTTATGNATLNGSNFNRLSGYTIPTNCVADFYRTSGGATQGKIGSDITAATFDDTGLVADGSSAPTVNTFVGEHWHVGNYTSDAAITATRLRVHIIGDFTLNHAMTVSTEMKGGLGGAGTTTAAANGGTGQGPGGGGGGQQGYSGFFAGGGGGANGGAGGMGGFNATGGSGRNGGQTYSIEHFLPGSGGGGGMGTASGAAGGNGGGCFYLEATGNFSIGASGSIIANGTAGAVGDAASNGGGGGGGSGGTVAFIIGGNFSLNATGTITCNGGNGGNASTANGPGGGGGGGGKAWGRVAGSSTVSGSISLSAGSAGTGVGSGSNGTAGSAGTADIVGGITYSVRTAA